MYDAITPHRPNLNDGLFTCGFTYLYPPPTKALFTKEAPELYDVLFRPTMCFYKALYFIPGSIMHSRYNYNWRLTEKYKFHPKCAHNTRFAEFCSIMVQLNFPSLCPGLLLWHWEGHSYDCSTASEATLTNMGKSVM